MKKFLLSLFLCFALFTGTALAADFSDLVILHTNDTHGYDQLSAEDGANGMARIAALKADLEAQGKEVLLLDAGDAIQDNNLVNFSQGATAIEFMNAAGYDAMCLGNHEFDYGQDVTLARVSEACFPVLACNIIVEATGESFVDSSAVIEKGGHKIGVVGMTTPESAASVAPNRVAGLLFLRDKALYEAVQKEVDRLKGEGCDLIVALGHLGSNDFNLGNRSNDVLANVRGIDVFIDGHDHCVKNEYVNGALLAETGSHTQNIGQIVWEKGVFKEKLIPYSADLREDEAVRSLIAQRAAEVEEKLKEKLGYVGFSLDGSCAPGVRTNETNLGDFITDAYLWQAQNAVAVDGLKVDGAIANGGGIRASIEAGDVTLEDIVATTPYNNVLYLMTIKGSDLQELLESATSYAPEPIGAFPQLAGIKCVLDTCVPFEKGRLYPGSGIYYAPKCLGARLQILEVGGKPFDEDKIYRIATIEFIVRGGDAYAHVTEPGAAELLCLGYVDSDALKNFLVSGLGGVVPELYRYPQGRIKIIE